MTSPAPPSLTKGPSQVTYVKGKWAVARWVMEVLRPRRLGVVCVQGSDRAGGAEGRGTDGGALERSGGEGEGEGGCGIN